VAHTALATARPHQVLAIDGSVVKNAKPMLDEAQLLEALRWMLLSRAYDECATLLQRQGRYGVFAPAHGQEAAVVGSAMALDPTRDWIVPQYRELVAVVHHGYPLERIVAPYTHTGRGQRPADANSFGGPAAPRDGPSLGVEAAGQGRRGNGLLRRGRLIRRRLS